VKPLQVIKNPEAFKLLGDETRRKIVLFLRVKEITVSQMADKLNITSQAIYHHIGKLQKGDVLGVAREERIGHLSRATTEQLLKCPVAESETMAAKNPGWCE
jgi:ArsR family transcriptional regulator